MNLKPIDKNGTFRMDAENTPEITGKTLQSMILGPKFGILPLDIRRRFSQNYNTKVTSPYEAAWAIIYGSNIDFETTLILEKAPEEAQTEATSHMPSEELPKKTLSFTLSCNPLSIKESDQNPLFAEEDENQLFPKLSKLKLFLVRFLELSLKTPGSHLAEMRLDLDLFPNVDMSSFHEIINNSNMEIFLSHVRRNNWYQIIPGKIGVESLFDTLFRAESAYPKGEDLLVWKDVNTLLIDPGVRAYIATFYQPFIQNCSLPRAKINEYIQAIENLPLRCVLM